MIIDTTQCIVCGKAFQGASKPRYAANARGVIVGAMHSSCAYKRSSFASGVSVERGMLLDQAQRWSYIKWLYLSRTKNNSTDRWYAETLLGLAEGDDTTLLVYSQDQRERLEWWTTRRGPVLVREKIEEEYRALVAEYRAWKEENYGDGPSKVDRYRALLVALTSDEFAPWSSDSSESYWVCAYCDGKGMDLPDDPRDENHNPACPFLVARKLVHGE